MLIYVVLLILIIFLNIIIKPNKSQNRNNLYINICLILFLIISMFRSEKVGADTQNFIDAFINIKNRSLLTSFEYSRFEKGFILLCKIISIFTSNPQALIMITSLFVNIVIFRFIKNNSINSFYSVLIYFCMNIFFLYMTVSYLKKH